MRIIIAGSRSFTDYDLLARKLDRFTSKLNRRKLTVISGHADGADKLGEKWALERLVGMIRIHKPDWAKHGKKAPMIRNQEMVDEADALIAFHVNGSPGTAHCIAAARRKGLKVRVVKIK